MNRSLIGTSIALAVVAAAVFAGVAIHELNYVADHPDRYGPAKAITWAAGGGTMLSLAFVLLAVSALRQQRS